MRITGGKARGIQLSVPKEGVRPATDFIRERIFNRLGDAVRGARILDCFAGTGAYGLECVSRGCQFAYFFEKHPQVSKLLSENAAKVCKSAGIDASSCIKIYTTDVFHMRFEGLHDIQFIFMDPPYPLWEQMYDSLVNLLKNLAQTFPRAFLMLEAPTKLRLTQETLWLTEDELVEKKCKKANAPSIHIYRTAVL